MRMHTFIAATAATAALTAQAEVQPSFRIYRPDNTGLPGDYVLSMLMGSDDKPWIAAFMTVWENGGMARFLDDRWETVSSIENPVIQSPRFQDMVYDAGGRMWIATDKGLLRYDPAVGPSSLVRLDRTGGTLVTDAIHDLAVAPDGSIWIAARTISTTRGALTRFDPSTGVSVHYTTTSSVPLPWAGRWSDSSVDHVAIVPDQAGNGYTVYFNGDVGVGQFRDGVMTDLGNPLDNLDVNGPTTPFKLFSNSSVDDLGNIWFQTNKGFARLSRDGQWTIAGYPPLQGTDMARLFALKGGRAVLGSFHAQVFLFDNGVWTNLGNWGSNNHTYTFAEDSQGRLWAGGIGGCARYAPDTGTWTRFRITNSSMTGYAVNDIAFHPDGRVFINGNAGPGIGGFNIFDGVRWTGVNNFNYGLGPAWNLPSDNVVSFCMRSEGDLALAIGGGSVYQWDGVGYTQLTTTGWSIRRTAEDARGRLWGVIASNNGVEVTADGINRQRYYSANSPITGTTQHTVEADPSRSGFVWLCGPLDVTNTDGTMWTKYGKSLLGLTAGSDTLTCAAPATDGTLWIGSNRGLYRFNPATSAYTRHTAANAGLFSDYVTGLEIAPDGTLWVSTFGQTSPYPGGLSHFDGATWTHFNTTNSALRHNQITAMRARSIAGGYELWTGMANEGVAVLTIRTAPTCVADFDASGALNIDDIFQYLNAWFVADPRCDVTLPAGVSLDDLFVFINRWFAGC